MCGLDQSWSANSNVCIAIQLASKPQVLVIGKVKVLLMLIHNNYHVHIIVY